MNLLTGILENDFDMDMDYLFSNLISEQNAKLNKMMEEAFRKTFKHEINVLKMSFNESYRKLFDIYKFNGKSYYTFCTRVYLIVSEPQLITTENEFTLTQNIYEPQTRQYIHIIDGKITFTDSRKISQR